MRSPNVCNSCATLSIPSHVISDLSDNNPRSDTVSPIHIFDILLDLPGLAHRAAVWSICRFVRNAIIDHCRVRHVSRTGQKIETVIAFHLDLTAILDRMPKLASELTITILGDTSDEISKITFGIRATKS